MESPLRPLTPSPVAPVPDSSHDIRRRWGADRERLLTVAGYADALTEAIQLVDRAFDEAGAVLGDAQREAGAIRDGAKHEAEAIREDAKHDADAILEDAERTADAATVDLRSEVARLESEIESLQADIARLEAKRTVAAAMTAFDPAPAPAPRASAITATCTASSPGGCIGRRRAGLLGDRFRRLRLDSR